MVMMSCIQAEARDLAPLQWRALSFESQNGRRRKTISRERRNGEKARGRIRVGGGGGVRVWQGVEEAKAGGGGACGGGGGELEASAFPAVDVHVAAEGLGGAELPAAKGARGSTSPSRRNPAAALGCGEIEQNFGVGNGIGKQGQGEQP
nr:hypothetical protein Itr_chr13CG11870 [Ipomoea trifida]